MSDFRIEIPDWRARFGVEDWLRQRPFLTPAAVDWIVPAIVEFGPLGLAARNLIAQKRGAAFLTPEGQQSGYSVETILVSLVAHVVNTEIRRTKMIEYLKLAEAFPWLRLVAVKDDRSCKAALEAHGLISTTGDQPELPLIGCDALMCRCRFQQVSEALRIREGW